MAERSGEFRSPAARAARWSSVGPIVGADTAQPASRYSLTAALAEHRSVDLGAVPAPARRRPRDVRRASAVRQGARPADRSRCPCTSPAARSAPSRRRTRTCTATSGCGGRRLWSAIAAVRRSSLVLMFLVSRDGSRAAASRSRSRVVFGLGTMMLPLRGEPVRARPRGAARRSARGCVARASDAVTPRRAALGRSARRRRRCSRSTRPAIVLVVLARLRCSCAQRARIGWFVLGAAGAARRAGRGTSGPRSARRGTRRRRTTRARSTARARAATRSRPCTTSCAVLFGNRGLLVGAPIVLVGLGRRGAGSCVAGRGRVRRHAIVGARDRRAVPRAVRGLVGAPDSSRSPGPRYLIPALPFLAVPLAVVWDRLWRPALLVATWSGARSSRCRRRPPTSCCGIEQPPFPELPRIGVRRRRVPPDGVVDGVRARLGVVLVRVATVVTRVVACVAAACAARRHRRQLAGSRVADRSRPAVPTNRMFDSAGRRGAAIA